MSPALRQRLHPLLAEALDDGWQAFVRSQYSEPASRDGERFAAWLAESSRRTRQLVNERGFARLGGAARVAAMSGAPRRPPMAALPPAAMPSARQRLWQPLRRFGASSGAAPADHGCSCTSLPGFGN
jgi:hypothetical protein